MRNTLRSVAVLAAAALGFALSAAPANAESGLSERTEKAWESWNEGGGKVGRGAAQMVSGAWIGAPSSVLDLATGPSERTDKAWESWNEGGELVGGGAAQMVSGAWIGAPSSILDLAGLGPYEAMPK